MVGVVLLFGMAAGGFAPSGWRIDNPPQAKSLPHKGLTTGRGWTLKLRVWGFAGKGAETEGVTALKIFLLMA
jgi:hypothetical protein